MSTPTFPQTVWLVAEREISSKVRSKSFIIGTIMLFALALGAVLWGGFSAASSADETTPVAATAEARSLLPTEDGLEITEVADRDAVNALVRSEDVDAGIVADPASPTGFTLIGATSAPSNLLMSLSDTPSVEVLDPDATDPMLRYFVALGFGIVFLLAAQTFGMQIATAVVEEKQTRVVEILISAIPSRALLAGKVIGNTILAMGQVIGLAAIAIIGLTVTGQDLALGLLGSAIAWFAVFFLFGFVLLAALFAAAGAMVSRQEDIGATITPLIWLIILPYMLVIFFNDNSTVLTIMSYVPFSAPVGMPMRLFLGEALWWEPLLSLVIMLASCVGAIALGAKIYDNSLLRMGARVKLAEALRG